MKKGQFPQWSWIGMNYKRNRLKIDTRKENCVKDVMDLIEKNYQIYMTSEHSVSSNALFKKYLNATSSKMFWEYCSSVGGTMLLFQCLLQGWCEHTGVMWTQL